MDGWALTVAVLAFVVSGAALVVAWWQLLLQRDASGGRGVIFDIRAPMRKIVNHDDGTKTTTNGYRVFARLVGNDRYEVGLHLERDGQPVDPRSLGIGKPPAMLRRWSCDDEPLRWDFDLDPAVADDLWCVLLWVSPFGEAVRTDGYRRRLGRDPEFEEWRWVRFVPTRRRFESWASTHGPGWFRRIAGRPRRLGAWKPYRLRPLQPGQSPTNSVRADA